MIKKAVHVFVSTLLILLSFCSFAVLSYAQGGDWATYLYNGYRQSNNTDETLLSQTSAENLQKLWTFKTGGIVASSATVAGNVVYDGSWDGNEYALDAATGKELWKTFLGLTLNSNCNTPHLGITSAAAVQNGIVYVGGGGPDFYALDAHTGAIIWQVFTGDNSITGGHYNWSSPLLYNGSAYVGIASSCDEPLVQGQLLQISLATHQIINTFNVVPDGQVGGGIWTSPSVDPQTNTIFVTTGTIDGTQPDSQALVALDASTLLFKTSWQVPTSQTVADSDFGTSPMVFPSTTNQTFVSAINKNGLLYVLNANNLSAGPVWEYSIAVGGGSPQAGQGSISSGSFANNQIFYAGGQTTINGTTYMGSIRSFDATTGNLLWQQGTEETPLDAIAYANGTVIDAAGDLLKIYNAANGNLLYTAQLNTIVNGAPSISNGTIYVGTVDGNITAFHIGSPTNTALGGTDINTYCEDNGIGAASVANNEWVCGSQVINITKVCQWQYKDPNAYAKQNTPGNIFTWGCYTTNSPTVTPTPTVSPTPTATVSPTPTISPTVTPTPTTTPVPTVSPTVTPTATPSASPTPSSSPTDSPTPTATVSPTPTVSPTVTPAPTTTPVPTVSPTVTPSASPTPSSQNVSSANASTPTPTTPDCTQNTPNAPQLISAASVNPTQVTLTWTKANSPVSYYLLAYGVSSGVYIYGAPNVGDQNATSYTVNDLQPNTAYYFVIRAVNGCTPGQFSNELSNQEDVTHAEINQESTHPNNVLGISSPSDKVSPTIKPTIAVTPTKSTSATLKKTKNTSLIKGNIWEGFILAIGRLASLIRHTYSFNPANVKNSTHRHTKGSNNSPQKYNRGFVSDTSIRINK